MASDALIFPDGVAAVIEMIHGVDIAGRVVNASRVPDIDPETANLAGPFPVVLVDTAPGGDIGYIDQIERVSVEVFDIGTTNTRTVTAALVSMLTGDGIETPSGVYLDNVKPVGTPTQISYTNDLDKANISLDITTRPV